MDTEAQPGIMVYARDSLAILRASLRLARTTRPAFYRVAALQLRLLLCDTTRRHGKIVDMALAPRLCLDLQLPQLNETRAVTGSPRLSLQAWLAQPLPGFPSITVRELIRRVCDQEGGAHVDPHREAGLPAGLDTLAWILRLGDLAVEELTRLIGDQSASGPC